MALLKKSREQSNVLAGLRVRGFVYVADPLNDPPLLVVDLANLPDIEKLKQQQQQQASSNGSDDNNVDDDALYEAVFDDLLLQFIAIAHRSVQRDYTVAIIVHSVAQRPSIAWFRRAYASLDRAYKKNLKQLYVVDASRWLRVLFALSRPFVSPKFWRKVQYLVRADLNVRPRLASVSRPLPPHRIDDLLQVAATVAPALRLTLPTTALGVLRGPTDDRKIEHDTVQSLGRSVAGLSVSTYPRGADGRLGQPIADHFRVDACDKACFIACIADGCGWGRKSSLASDLACNTFVQTLKNELTVTPDTTVQLVDVADSLIQSLLAADAAIGKGSTGPREECGTTTLCGVAVLRAAVDSADTDAPYVVALISVGDCKAYLRRAATGTIEDVTLGNRPVIGNAHDPGGRIGPAVDVRDADLRNVVVRFVTDCSKGDVLMLVSDGVSDNIDPGCMQVPCTSGSWDEAPAERQQYALRLLERITKETTSSVADTATAVIGHCVRVLQPLADFMEAHPNDRQPPSLAGKPDHTTCCVMRFEPFVAPSTVKASDDNNNNDDDDDNDKKATAAAPAAANGMETVDLQ
jgi:serine/threonine protein phosphatase PrpC